MNSRQLQAFRAVARAGTVTAAAQSLYISQPAVSRLIAHLESQLDLKLFERAHGRLRLTPEGDALLREVERHFLGLDAIESAARRIAEHGPGSLRIVGFPSITSGVLPHAVAAMLRRHPATTLTLDTDTTDRIAGLVESGRYDVGFSAGHVSGGRAVELRVVASRPWVCVFPPGHRLCGKERVTPGEVARETLVGFSAGMSLREEVERLFAESGERAQLACAAQTIESICALVAAGCGGAVIHPYARHVASMYGLTGSVLEGPARLELAAVMPPAAGRAQFVEHFVDEVAQLYAGPTF